MDIVVPYRQSRSEELRYALRSLKNVPHSRVFIIGDRPSFVSGKVIHIPYRQGSDIAKNTLNILNLAVDVPEVSDNFIWMADDMYFMQKVYRIPVLHRGSYDDVLAKYENRRFNYYVQRQIKTNEKLKSIGINNPLCYEIHVPFVINKKKWMSVREHITPEFNKLSMYGNLCNIGGTKPKYKNSNFDVKVRQKDWIPDGAFASSHDATFGTNSLGKLVRERFSERSEYEK